MPTLTAEHIAEQERQTAEHFEHLAYNARKCGDQAGADEYSRVAAIALAQAARADREAQHIN